jgi:RHS repeat-associated protein
MLMARLPYTYTEDGEVSTLQNCFGTTTYIYNSFGYLKKITKPDGTVIEYKLDALNRRIKKLINGKTKEYYLWYDQLKLAAILDANKQAKIIYIYGSESAYVPSILIKDNKIYKMITDPGTSSVRYVMDVDTAVVAQTLEYDESGNILKNTNPDFQPLTFAGGLSDTDTKLIRFGAREYDPTVGRWTSKDPIGFNGGDTNLYAYVGGNPMSAVDPSGLIFENSVSTYFTPEQQIVGGAGLTALGSLIARVGIGLTSGVATSPEGALLIGVGGAIVYEGGLNSYKGLKRKYEAQLEQFNAQANISFFNNTVFHQTILNKLAKVQSCR